MPPVRTAISANSTRNRFESSVTSLFPTIYFDTSKMKPTRVIRNTFSDTSPWTDHFSFVTKSVLIPVRFTDDGLYDYSGWDLRKTLRLFASCNPTLYEQLQSPIVYTADSAFHQAVLDLIPVYFQPKKALFHYLGIAAHSMETVRTQKKMEIKKLFYVLRPLLACLWMAERKAMPPTKFFRLFESVELDSSIRNEIDRLLIQKQSAKEKELAEIAPELAAWTKHVFEYCDKLAKTFSATEKPGWEPLNHLFLKFVWIR